MVNKIKAQGTTKRGSHKFKLFNKERFFEDLKSFDGNIEIEIRLIEDSATHKQVCFFRNEVVSELVHFAANSGQGWDHSQAEKFLIQKAGFQEEDCTSLSKKQMSFLIDESKQFIQEMFK